MTIQIRRDSAADWTTENPTPANGQLCLEEDTRRFKIGNGSSAWTSLPYAGGPAPVVTVSGTTQTPTTVQAGSYFVCTNASGCTVTVPTNAAQPFPIGTTLTYEQNHATGEVDINPDTGVTLNVAASRLSNTAEQYAVAQLIKVGTDAWTLFGNLEAAP